MNLEADAVAVIWLGTAIALFYVVVRLLAAWLVAQGGTAESVGKALLNIYPG